MFKFLEAARLHGQAGGEAAENPELDQFLSGLPKFAFYRNLQNVLLRQGHQLDRLIAENNCHPVVDALLDSLNYAKLPKGLMTFHRYGDMTRTPIEEHLAEAVDYAKDDEGRARVHFTVSPDHQGAVQQHIEQARHRLDHHSVTWLIGCSVQPPSTDTIAVDMDNCPFRDAHGNLLFRPGGHGALLSNLHEIHGDVVFIKNIDNVVHEHLHEISSKYKKVLGGLLVGLQGTLFSFLAQLESDTVSSASLEQMTEWARHSLALKVPDEWSTCTNSQQTQWLFTWLNRPLRVCGMVPNVNHRGGPFG